MNLNSEFTQWALKLALSKGGVAVRWLVALIIGALAKQQIFPDGDLHEIETGLTSGLMALVALAYGWLEWWIQHRQKDGVRALQVAANRSGAALKVDGIAGNSSVAAMSEIAGVSSSSVVATVKGKNKV